MSSVSQTPVSCPKCGQRFAARVEQILDVSKDPNVKARLLAGQINVAQCPNCGFQVGMGAPIAYHDSSKELLLIHVPMELNLNRDDQEQLVGRLVRTITDDLPMEKRKGYLLNPRRTFTLQGMIDTILEADGITKEMVEAQRKKSALIEQLLRTPPDQLENAVKEHDGEIDAEFFAMMTSIAESIAGSGRADVAEQILALSDVLVQYSTYGNEMLGKLQAREEALEKVTQDLNGLGDKISNEVLAELLLSYSERDDLLEAFVGLARPALDYAFFETLTGIVESQESEDALQKANQVRDKLLELVEAADQQSQAMVQQAGNILQEIVNSDNVTEAVQHFLPAIDNVFMAVLDANVKEAERQQNAGLLGRLQEVQQAISRLILDSSPPEIKFINELLQASDELEARLILSERIGEFGPPLLDYLDALVQQVSDRGQVGLAQRLIELRAEAEKILS